MKHLALCVFVALLALGAAEAQTINVLLWDDPYPRALQTMLPEFEKATGIKVNIEMLPPPQVFQKTAIAVAANSTDFDVVAIDEGNIPVFAGLMSTYDSWPAGRVFPKIDPKTVTPNMLEVAQWDGKLIGLPINGNLYVWMTRRDLIENAGYRRDFRARYGYDLGVPKTFKELLEMGTFFHERGIAAGFGPFTGGPAGVFGEAIFMWESHGSKFIEYTGGTYRLVLNENVGVEGMEFYKQLMRISPKGAETMAHVERQAAFAADPKGVFSMFIWPAQIAAYENPDKSLVAGKILYSAPPAGPKGRAAVRGTWALNIPNASRNKAAAAEFVYWWASSPVANKLIEANTIPARTDALSNPKYAKDKPWLAAIAESMKFAVTRPRFKEVAQVQDIVRRYWIQGITGAMPTRDAVRAIMKETQDVLTKAGY